MESVIGSEGIPGIGALTRSGRTVGFAENLPYALWVKRIFRKNLVVSGFRTFRAPETDSIRTGSAKAYKKSRRL